MDLFVNSVIEHKIVVGQGELKRFSDVINGQIWCYIGETGRAFNTRKKEHLRNTKTVAKGSSHQPDTYALGSTFFLTLCNSLKYVFLVT